MTEQSSGSGRGEDPHLIVGVGAGAGGWMAARELLTALGPAARRMAFLIASRDDDSPANDTTLTEATSLSLVELRDSAPLQAGDVARWRHAASACCSPGAAPMARAGCLHCATPVDWRSRSGATLQRPTRRLPMPSPAVSSTGC